MDPVIAVDIGGTTTRIALVAGNGTILKRAAVPTPVTGDSPAVVAETLIREIPSLLPPGGLASAAGIGIGAAGPVDFRTGEVMNPPNLGFPRIPLVRPLEEALGLPVFVINDCHAGMLGEACFGAARGRDCTVYVTISTGIGGALIEQGRLLLGHAGNALEIGHFTVDGRYSMPCGCGHTGHWEGYASGMHLPRFCAAWRASHGVSASAFEGRSAGAIFSAARGGNAEALRFLDELGRINARAISNIVVAFDPSLIVMDGSVVLRNQDLLIPPIERYADRFLPLPEIQVSLLDGLAPLLGAAVIARGYDTPFGSFTRFC
jgi:glucokinase